MQLLGQVVWRELVFKGIYSYNLVTSYKLVCFIWRRYIHLYSQEKIDFLAACNLISAVFFLKYENVMFDDCDLWNFVLHEPDPVSGFFSILHCLKTNAETPYRA